MTAHRVRPLAVTLISFGVVAPVFLAGPATGQPAESARSSPKDTTPYVRPAIPEDHAPGGQRVFSFTAPFMVDVVVSNTNTTLTNTDTFNDGETSIAVNPQNPDEILITSFANAWGAHAPWWHSTDGGQTWTKRFTIAVPPGRPFAAGCPCDQAIDYGRNGRAFGAFLIGADAGGTTSSIVSGGSSNPNSAAAFLWNAPGGITQLTNFNAPTDVDQPWLLVNRDPASAFQDNVYVAYDDYGVNPVGMRVATALGTFPPDFARDVQTGTAAGAINPGHRLAVDPQNGWVYDIWQTCVVNCATLAADPKTIEYRLNRSRDGGATWDFAGGTVVATAGSSQPRPKFGAVNALLGGVLHAAVDPLTGDLYYVYGENGGSTNTNRLALRRLTTAPVTDIITVGPERLLPVHGLSQAIPAVAVTDNGIVGVFHYSFDGLQGNLPVFTAWLETSDTQGVNWTSQALLTFLSSAADSCPPAPGVNNPCHRQRVLGDYMQMKAAGNTLYGAFTGNGVPFGRPFANHDPIFFKVSATLQAAGIVTGAGEGATAHVRGFTGTGVPTNLSFLGYPPGFGGGVRVATGDVNGDGVADLITGPGPTGGPHVRVLSGPTASTVLTEFLAYAPGFTNGLFVAAGDVDGDGRADIVTGAGPGGGPHVTVTRWNPDGSLSEIRSFLAYSAGFAGGITVAACDIDGDGFADIVTGAGPGGGPHVQVFSGRTGAVLRSFLAYDPGMSAGIFVACGDVDGDGIPDIITGVGAGGGPHVQVFSGGTGAVLASFFAYDPGATVGMRVAAADLDADRRAEIITAPGGGGGPHVKAFRRNADGSVSEVAGFFAYAPAFLGGVFVAGMP